MVTDSEIGFIFLGLGLLAMLGGMAYEKYRQRMK